MSSTRFPLFRVPSIHLMQMPAFLLLLDLAISSFLYSANNVLGLDQLFQIPPVGAHGILLQLDLVPGPELDVRNHVGEGLTGQHSGDFERDL